MAQNYLLLLPLTVVIIWVVVFVMNGRHRELHDRLFLALAGCSAMTYAIVIHSLVEGMGRYHLLLLDNLETLTGLSICPLLFLYIRAVAHDAMWHKWYVWLFVPAVLITFSAYALMLVAGCNRVLVMRNIGSHAFYSSVRMVDRLYYAVNVQLFNITLEVMSTIMIVLCIFYLSRYARKAKHYYANIEESSVSRIHSFLVCSTLNIVILLIMTAFIRCIVWMQPCYLLPISFSIGLLLWMMSKSAFGIIVAKENLAIIESLPEIENEDIPLEPYAKIGEMLATWQSAREKKYCREGITLADVARDLQVSPRLLSAFINRTMKMNFRHWINSLRIAEAKRLIIASPDEKLTYISSVCGYPDLATFSKAFRQMEGCSPLEYRLRTEDA